MKDFYVNIKNTDSLNHFPTNSKNSFTLNFPIDLHIHGFPMKCALVDISHPPVITDCPMITLHCDAVTPSVIDSSLKPILRRFPNRRFDGMAYSSPQYIKIKSERIVQMSFSLRDDNSELIQFSEGVTYITLHFTADI